MERAEDNSIETFNAAPGFDPGCSSVRVSLHSSSQDASAAIQASSSQSSEVVNNDTEGALATESLSLNQNDLQCNVEDCTSQSIHSTDNPTSNIQHSPSDQDTKRTVYDSLGFTNACVIIGGTILSLAALGFLIFLWTGRGKEPEGQGASHSWRIILLSGRLTQLITISSLILRASISMQTATCTSFVAALILERRSIPLSQSASLSVLRSVNSGPLVLINQIFSQGLGTRHLYPEVILFLLLAIGSIVAQFSSTILLSDLRNDSLAGFSHEVGRNLTITDDIPIFTTGWALPPRDNSLFGELPTGYNARPNQNGLSDTGVKRRAMLPFTQEQERATIRNYEGPSMVFSSRVACMPPVVSGEIEILIDTIEFRRSGHVTGQIHLKETFRIAGLASQSMCDSGACQSHIPFHCSILSVYGDADPIAASFCTLQSTDQSISTSTWKISMDPWTSAASAVLVFSTNMDDDRWKPFDNSSIKLLQPNTKDEWESYDFGSGSVVNITLCYNVMNVMLSNVSMSTNIDLTEPKLGYKSDLSDSADIRNFFGANPMVQDLSERGVLKIGNITDKEDYIYGVSDFSELSQSDLGAGIMDSIIQYKTANETLWGCDSCEGDAITVARAFTEPFLDIIISTQRASVALQTIYTMLALSTHDQILPFCTVSIPVKVVQTQSTIIPIRYLGLIAVTAIVLINIVCILTLTALYLFYSRYSMIGNFWHAISQAASAVTSDILSYSNMKKDCDISNLIGEADHPVRLMKLPETSLIKIMEVEPVSGEPLSPTRSG
ncbi:hypothetical protein HD806DRAFT_542571 [Xylariaceae sp. AK1471]|nr:hypothetical protein HD806DRAFT_542571 [Xylariaceae sp. AK1471]